MTAGPPPRRAWRRRAVVLALVLVAGWAAASLAVAFALPRRWSALEVERVPQPDGIAVLELELRAADGARVPAWLFAPDAPSASIVLLHGWRGSRSTMTHRALELARLGHAVLAPSLRAHGDAEGERYDFGLEAWRDAAACVDELRRRRPERPVVLAGCSYGAAVAVETAARSAVRVDALVLDSLFADLAGAVRRRCELFLPPVLEDLAAWGLAAAAPIAYPELDAIRPAQACARIDPGIQVLVLRGACDERVSAEETELVVRALGPRAELVVFANADHDRCLETDAALWRATVGAFCARTELRR